MTNLKMTTISAAADSFSAQIYYYVLGAAANDEIMAEVTAPADPPIPSSQDEIETEPSTIIFALTILLGIIVAAIGAWIGLHVGNQKVRSDKHPNDHSHKQSRR